MDPQYTMNCFSLADLFERIDRYDEAYDIYRQLSSNPKHSKRALSSMRRLSDRMKSGSGESGSGESGSGESGSRRHTRGGSSSSSGSSSHSGSESNKMIRAAEKLWKEQNNINAAKRLLRRVLKLDSSNSRAIKLLRDIDDDEEL